MRSTPTRRSRDRRDLVAGLAGVLVPSAMLVADLSCRKMAPCTGEPCDAAPVMLEGDPAPGTGASFQMFDRPNIAVTGAVAYTADTDGQSESDDVVYVDDLLVAREGDPAPGVPGGTLSVFEPFETAHQVNAAGDVVYIATLRDVPDGADRAIYLNATLVAHKGATPPGIPGRGYNDFGFAGVTDAGAAGYLADLDGSTSDDSVIFLDGAVLFREDDSIAALPGETWDGNFDEVQWNGRGDVLFEGNTSLPTGTDTVLYRRLAPVGAGGAVEEVVAQEGQPIDALDGPDFLELILQTALAEDGRWGLRGTLGLAGPTSDSIILTGDGFFRQQGESVPELPGVVLGNFTAISVNGQGDVLYLADLEGATPPGVDEGLFLNCCLVLTDGAQVPGLPEGTLFSDLGFEDAYLTDDREVVLAGGYNGSVSGDGIFRLACEATRCPGDVDGDGTVGVDDLTLVILAWGGDDPAADLDGDGVVSFGDLLAVIQGWGACPA